MSDDDTIKDDDIKEVDDRFSVGFGAEEDPEDVIDDVVGIIPEIDPIVDPDAVPLEDALEEEEDEDDPFDDHEADDGFGGDANEI